MIMTQAEAYEKFKEKNKKKIGFTSFKILRPANVRRISETNRRTCLCTICANVALKVEALGKHFNKKADGCKSDEKKANLKKIAKMKKNELVSETLCPKEHGMHGACCLRRTCSKCGPKNLDKLILLEDDDSIDWNHWEHVQIQKYEKTLKCMSCVPKKTILSDFLTYLKKDLETYPAHQFRASWQHEQMAKCQASLTDNQVMIVMDFSENYNCKFQNEVQSAFFDQNQVTVHPFMVYYRQETILVKHSVVIISDDTKHDHHSVDKFRQCLLQHLQTTIDINEIHEWSDGCAAQYKGRASFADVSLSKIKVTRNFFETSHGKSVCDGIGAITKNACYRAVLSGRTVLGTAIDVHQYLKDNLTVTENMKEINGKKEISKREFMFVTDIVHDRPEVNVNTVSGTRKFHCVQSINNPYHIQSRNLSCYCKGCLGNIDLCENLEYVEPWESHNLVLQQTNTLKGTYSKVQESGIKDGAPKKTKKSGTGDSAPKKIKKSGIGDCGPKKTKKSDTTDRVPQPMKNSTIIETDQFLEVILAGKKSNSTFVAQVLDVDRKTQEMHLSFMKKVGELYMWPYKPETSWEATDCVSRVLSNPRLSEKSTNNRQYYYFNETTACS